MIGVAGVLWKDHFDIQIGIERGYSNSRLSG